MSEHVAEDTKSPSLEGDALLNGLSFALRLVFLPLAAAWVARSLGPVGQGRFGYAHGVAAVGAYFVLWGLAHTVTRFVARSVGSGQLGEGAHTVRITRTWVLRSSAMAVGVGLPIAAFLESGPERILVCIAVPYAAVIALYAFWVGLGVGLRRYDLLLFGHIFYLLVLFLGLAAALPSAHPVLGAVLVYCLARSLHLLFLMGALGRAAKRELGAIGPAAAPPDGLRDELFGFASQMTLVVLATAVLWERTEVVFLRVLSSPEMLGYYTAAVALAILVFRVPGVLSVVILPVVAELEGAKAPPEELGRLLRRGSLALCWLLSPGIAVLAVLSKPIVAFLYGPEFGPSGPILGLLLLPVIFAGAETVCARSLVGAGRQSILLRWNLCTAALNLLLCGLLIGRYGGLGAAAACSGALAVQILGVTFLGFRAFPAPNAVDLRDWILLFVAVCLAVVVALLALELGAGAEGQQLRGLILALVAGLGTPTLVLAALRFRPLRLDPG